MNMNALSQDEIRKIKHTVTEAVRVKMEIKDLNDGMKDVIKHVCEELDIKPKDLNKAVSIRFKEQENSDALEQEKDGLELVEELLGYVR